MLTEYSIVIGALFGLSLSSADMFMKEPSNITVEEGESAYFPCVFHRKTERLPSWNINGSQRAYSTRFPPGFKPNRSGLIVERVTERMNGVWVYCCFSDDCCSRTAYITVKHKTSGVENQSLSSNSSFISTSASIQSMVTETSKEMWTTQSPPSSRAKYRISEKTSSSSITPVTSSTASSHKKEQPGIYLWTAAVGIMVCVIVILALSLSCMVYKECKRVKAKIVVGRQVEPVYDMPIITVKSKPTTKENEAYNISEDPSTSNPMQRNRAYSTSNIQLESLRRSIASIDNVYESVI